MAWSPDGQWIAYDSLGDDGYYDIHLMRPDGSEDRCLTCETSDPDLARYNGNPAWHPSGRYLVFQVEKAQHPGGSFESTPGIGKNSDLWLMDREGGRYWKLTSTPGDRPSGVLHPHFSHDGNLLTWSERYEDAKLFDKRQFMGAYHLKVANFRMESNGPRLFNEETLKPGGVGFYENHGLDPRGRTLLFTSNFGAKKLMELDANDIYSLNLSEALADGKGTPILLASEGYNEHAQWSPNGKKIVWMTSAGNPNRGTDYWIMDASGANRFRITGFNRRSDPIGKGRTMTAADNSWSPDGRRIVAYIQTSLLKQEGMIVMIELEPEIARMMSD